MRSVRRRLTAWLLGGLTLLWLAAGAGVFVAVRASLLNALDAELAVDATVVRFMVRGADPEDAESPGERRGGAGRLHERVPAYEEPDSGSFFEAWTPEGETIERSPSLGSLGLPFPGDPGVDPVFGNARLEDVRKIRTMAFRVSGGGKGGSKRPGPGRRGGAIVVLLAKDLAPVNETLSSLAGGLAVVGVLAAAGAVALVSVALERGLKPLRQLGAQTDTIDVTSLDSRFDTGNAPAELLPVYNRLNDLMARIEKSFERERRFSSDLAHEMRTPVAQLKMLSEIALKWPDQAGPDSHREGLELACQLESMITNLLALARWESGEVPLKEEPVSLSSLVEECWKRHSQTAEAKHLRIQRDLGEAPTWLTDPDLLRHIVDNLLSNAIEYTPAGKQIGIFGRSDGLEIANRAPELTQDDVEHLFERYWRRDSARADSRHTGLGLSVAKACSEALGLELSVRKEDENVRFFLRRIGEPPSS